MDNGINTKLCSPQQISLEYGLKPKMLAALRCSGDGPPFIKVGRSVYYDRADFEVWLLSRKVKSTSQGGAK
ncbi:MAG: helix-turn-helix domain-containing protein [Candidatus Obscuribacterales bacterium]